MKIKRFERNRTDGITALSSVHFTAVVKVIFWELCKEVKFHQTNKWYMHKAESVYENETLKILWDFEIQIDSQKTTPDDNYQEENNLS